MTRYVTRKSSREAIRELQRSLAALGFNPGRIDGALGKNTKAAVEAFQRANGLPVDGVVGPRTLAKLSSDSAEGASRLPRSRPDVQDGLLSKPSSIGGGLLSDPEIPGGPLSGGGIGSDYAHADMVRSGLPDLDESDRLIEDYRETTRGNAFSAIPARPPQGPAFDPLAGHSGRGAYTQASPAEFYPPEVPRPYMTIEQMLGLPQSLAASFAPKSPPAGATALPPRSPTPASAYPQPQMGATAMPPRSMTPATAYPARVVDESEGFAPHYPQEAPRPSFTVEQMLQALAQMQGAAR